MLITIIFAVILLAAALVMILRWIQKSRKAHGEKTELQAYVDRLSGVGDLELMKYGENYAISVMATFFKGEADKEKVRFHCSVQAPKALWLSSDVLTVILSSMWQNALEACRKVRDKERYIRTHIVYKEGKLLIRCENSFTGELRYGKNGSLLQSTKREHHGQGIPNIQRLAKENGGNCFYEQDEGRFFLTVVLMDKQARGRVGAKKNVSNSDM